MPQKYTVIVGDVIKSGKIRERDRYWSSLQDVTNSINTKYREEFYAPITILKGDEISAVLNRLHFSYAIMRDFQEMFYPYQIRFVSVYDEIDIALETRNASLMDGPAFWKANEYLEYIKKRKLYFKFDFGNNVIDNMLTTIANLVAFIKYDWSEREKEIIDLYEKTKRQEIVAKEFNISQQSVSDALKRAHWQIVRESEEVILKVLRSYK
ncbi:MAG TPA: hypothetical protein ENG74_01300 [Thermoplasmatales archaeon]|nr:hypothetical protein [Thermoplasmatales archaeon]